MSEEKKTRSERRRLMQGRVVSDKMEKTRVMLVETMVRHPLFKKSIRRSKRYKFHDEKNESRAGDIVVAVETRPLSRDKHHRLFRIVERAK